MGEPSGRFSLSDLYGFEHLDRMFRDSNKVSRTILICEFEKTDVHGLPKPRSGTKNSRPTPDWTVESII